MNVLLYNVGVISLSIIGVVVVLLVAVAARGDAGGGR